MYSLKHSTKILFLYLSLLACLLSAGCAANQGERNERSVWLVHATDPHIYLSRKDDSDDAKRVQQKQQELDEKALTDLLRQIRVLPQAAGGPTFLLFTGGFGVDPCHILTAEASKKEVNKRTSKECLGESIDRAKRDAEVQNLAKLLGGSPIQDIYFVAGNNDLPLESASDDPLQYFNQFFDDVQTKITENKSNVQLHNLTRCYVANGAPTSTCFADITNSPYRLIGFPSQSFKNKEPDSQSNLDLQVSQFETFRTVLDQARQAGKKVLIATHVPELDDPYDLAQGRYAGASPDPSIGAEAGKENPRARWSTWNVRPKLLDDWKNVVSSESVMAIFAGHFHDVHKEIYRQPYSWSTPNDHRVSLEKLFLAPPLSVRNQDASPIQARGFALIRLGTDRIGSQFYWYDSETGQFNAEPHLEVSTDHARESQRFHWRFITPFYWLLKLDQQDTPLQRMAILLIALLTAFLTVVAIWQIPATDDPMARKRGDDKSQDKGENKNGTPTNGSPFTTRFGKTVLAGLGGLVFAEVTKTLGSQQPSADTKWYYIVCFIFFFFVLVLGLNLFRAGAEALRARVAIIHYPLIRPIPPKKHWWERFIDWFSYWSLRIAHWFFSLRVPLLTFFDTFINLIQGKNQTTTRAFQDALIEQHANIIRAADALRTKLNSLLELTVSSKATAHQSPSRSHVRVNISVLSADQSTAFYISRTPDSARVVFPKKSVAWVSIFTGRIRWYQDSYASKKKDIILFDNQDGTIREAKPELTLEEYYQQRHDDYKAFVVFPIPWPRRGFDDRYVKGGLHISFLEEDDFHAIWHSKDVNVAALTPTKYPENDEKMLYEWCDNDTVRIALLEALAVLGELLRGFNEFIYQNYVEPNQSG